MAVIGTFGSFTAARMGIYASQSSLNVTGNNIANINTKGYTRQRLDLVSLNNAGSARYANSFNLDIGYGVIADSVSQLRDPYLDILYRDEQANLGASKARLDGLKQLSHILDEVGDGEDDFGVLEAQFDELLKQLENLSLHAGDEQYDTTVRATAKTLCQNFHDYATALAKTKDTLTENLQGNVKDVNTILTQIRDLNVQIREAGIHRDSALELRDARNVLIDDLSSYMKIDVRYSMEKIGENTEVEKLTISLADTGHPPIKLVDGIYGTQLSMPEMSAKRNPNYDPTVPTACRYIRKDSTAADIKYTNSEQDAMRGPGGEPVTNDGDGEKYLRDNNIFTDGLPAANFYDKAGAKKTTGKYLTADDEGTDVFEDAEQVDNAKLGSDENRLWMQLQPLVDEKGRYLKDEYYRDITEPVDLGDNTLYGSLQSLREILTEEGEFASEEDMKFDVDANIKRGVPYYQHTLDALAKKFAETMNEANSTVKKDTAGNIVPVDGKLYNKVFQGYETETDANGVQRYKIADPDSDIYKAMVTAAEKLEDADGNPLTDDKGVPLKNLTDDEGNPLKIEREYLTRVDLSDLDIRVQNAVREIQKGFFPLKGFTEENAGTKTVGVPVFKGGVLFSNRGDGDDVSQITAENISISKSWSTGANRIVNTKKPDMVPHSTDPDNIRHIITLMNEDMEYRPQDINDIIAPKNQAKSTDVYFKGSFQDMLSNFNVILATDHNTTKTQYDGYDTKVLARDNDRTSISGVDLNEEATSMMQFQKSYAAACQLLTTLDSMLDKLINGTL